MKKLFAFVTFFGAAFTVVAQDSVKTFWSDPLQYPLTPLYALMLLVFIVILLVMVVGVTLIRVLNTFTERVARERAEKLGVEYKPKPSIWNRFAQMLNRSVPLDEEKSIELDHDYDGIKELDNHLPPWWKWLFYGTIGWSAVYLAMYHYSDSLPLQIQEYQNEVAAADKSKKEFLALQPKVEIDENTLTYTADIDLIGKGKELYIANCSPCHKGDGGGGIGPNLTDDYWLHGGDIKNIYGVIKNGVPEKGMISWAGVLSPEQLRNVSFYVMSLHGTNPAGAKAPQGEFAKSSSTGMEKDSVKQVQAHL